MKGDYVIDQYGRDINSANSQKKYVSIPSYKRIPRFDNEGLRKK